MRKSKLANICLFTALGIILLNVIYIMIVLTSESSSLLKPISRLYVPVIILSVIIFILSIVSLVRILASKKQLKGSVKSVVAMVLSVIIFIMSFIQGIIVESAILTNELSDSMEGQVSYNSFEQPKESEEAEQEDSGYSSGFGEWEKFEKMIDELIRTSSTPEGPNEIMKGRWGATIDEIKAVEEGALFEKDEGEDSYLLKYYGPVDDVWTYSKSYGFSKQNGLKSFLITLDNIYEYDENENFAFRDPNDFSAKGAYEHYKTLKEKLQSIYGEPYYNPNGEASFYMNNVSDKDKKDTSKWDEFLGKGNMGLSCQFVAKNTSIKLYAIGMKPYEGKTVGQVVILCSISKNE